MRTLFSFLLTLLVLGGAAAQVRVEVLPESRLVISGTSSINRFSCVGSEINGYGVLEPLSAKLATPVELAGAADPEVSFAMKVRSFDCGNDKMNEDFYAALKSDRHPLIHFDMRGASILSSPSEASEWLRFRVRGEIKLAGVSKVIDVDMRGRQLPDDRVYATGSRPLRMSDFGIEPPTALWGLIKANDRIEVKFELIGAPEARRQR